VECNDLAQDSNKWQAIVKTVINFRLHKMRGVACLADLLKKGSAPWS
jgi:hypothetical protein